MSSKEKEILQETWVPQLSNLKLQIAAILHTAESQSSALQFLRALGEEISGQWKALGGEKWSASPVESVSTSIEYDEEVPGLTRAGVDAIAEAQADDLSGEV